MEWAWIDRVVYYVGGAAPILNCVLLVCVIWLLYHYGRPPREHS